MGIVKNFNCPSCGGKATKAIYFGLPMKICLMDDGFSYSKDSCYLLWGFWSFLIERSIIPFNGLFMPYKGSYLKALWHWLFMNQEEE